ncbi:hypothetical protein [Paucibacter soli]|uniref:hypothetical protein n=1 Tax=Paucibacter soli TaxID=3133433 RepID=UPI003094C137
MSDDDSPLDISPFTDPQWWAMCSINMDLPHPLDKADLSRPFVYQRGYGVFYVPGGRHQAVMSLLLAFQHGLNSGVDVANKLSLEYSSGTADHWLEHTPGAAFKSSVGKHVQVAGPDSLTAIERRILGSVQYVFR